MKRITIKESKNYVPYTNESLNGVAEYFTLTPSPEGGNWEDVTYYTSRKEDQYINRDGEGDSWVYVLSNPTMPGLLKIGSTSKSPVERAKEISRGTGVPMPYDVIYAFRCFNALRLELELHKYFKQYRTNNQKEFFRMDLDEVKAGINERGIKYI